MTPDLYRWQAEYHGGDVRNFIAPDISTAILLADPWGVLYHVDRKEHITTVALQELDAIAPGDSDAR